MKKHRFKDTVFAGVIAAVVIACGNGAMEILGEALEDGGEALSDAGEVLIDAGRRFREDAGELIIDAGQQLRDSGEALKDSGTQILSDAGNALNDAGDALQDAGEILQDAGEATMDAGDAMLQDASAQSSCGNCNDEGFQRMLTADTDWNQIRGQTVQGDDWTLLMDLNESPLASNYYFYKELTDGPLVLTDVHGVESTMTLFTVERGNDCFEEYDSGYAVIPLAWRIPTDSRTIVVASPSTRIQGARIVIKADETLCAYAQSAILMGVNPEDINVSNRFLWSGFQPYQ